MTNEKWRCMYVLMLYCTKRAQHDDFRLVANIMALSPYVTISLFHYCRMECISIIYDSVEIIHDSLRSSTHKTVYVNAAELCRVAESILCSVHITL